MGTVALVNAWASPQCDRRLLFFLGRASAGGQYSGQTLNKQLRIRAPKSCRRCLPRRLSCWSSASAKAFCALAHNPGFGCRLRFLGLPELKAGASLPLAP